MKTDTMYLHFDESKGNDLIVRGIQEFCRRNNLVLVDYHLIPAHAEVVAKIEVTTLK